MVPAQNRFHGNRSLQNVYRRGKTIRTELYTLRVIQNTSRKHSRIAIVVSKKVYKHAVKRNRIRRRFYETLRPFIVQNPGIDIAFIITSQATYSFPQPELSLHLYTQLKRAGLQK